LLLKFIAGILFQRLRIFILFRNNNFKDNKKFLIEFDLIRFLKFLWLLDKSVMDKNEIVKLHKNLYFTKLLIVEIIMGS